MDKFYFSGSSGDKLAARLDKPEGKIKAYALFAHCFTCGKDVAAASRIARALNNYGIAVLRFDFTGLGMSEGEFSNTNFTSNVKDLICAADHMREELEAPKILIGHSLGGTAVLKAAAEISETEAIVTIGAPSDAGHVSEHFEDKLPEIEEKGEAEVTFAGRSFKIKEQFVHDIENQNMESVVKDLKTPLLILHGPFDDIVGIENAGRIFGWAKHPKSFVSLDDADHLLSRAEDSRYAASVISAWVDRYIKSGEDESREDKSSEKGHVIVKSRSKDKFAQDISLGSHNLTADEPESVGGEDKGPDPYDLLMASLGACTSMTLQMYSKRKEWPLEGVEVHLSHEKIHADDCEECEGKKSKLDKFERKLVIKGEDLSEEQKEKLIEIADKCPVHKTLTSETVIQTTMKSGD